MIIKILMRSKKLQTLPLNNDKQLDVVYDPVLSLAKIRQELESRVAQREYGVIIVDYLNQVKRHNAQVVQDSMTGQNK